MAFIGAVVVSGLWTGFKIEEKLNAKLDALAAHFKTPKQQIEKDVTDIKTQVQQQNI
jgi:hypothetical protein